MDGCSHKSKLCLLTISIIYITLLINVIKKIFKLNGYYICINEILFFTKLKYQKKKINDNFLGRG